jgi:hypothetical protein
MTQFPDDPTALTFVEYDVPDREKIETLLRDLGADRHTIDTAARNVRHVDIHDLMARFRSYAQANPGIVLGALSALVAGGAVAAGAAVKKSSTKKKAAARKAPAKKKAAASRKRSSGSSKRTLIEPHAGDKRYIRRDAKGRIKQSVDVGRSLAADKRSKSKTKSKPGQGDKGDR